MRHGRDECSFSQLTCAQVRHRGATVTIADVDYNAPPPDDAELPAILNDLIDRASHLDVNVRRSAIEQIYELALKVNAKAASAIPCLVGGLVDPDSRIGESSLWALHYCAPDSIDPLVDCLSHHAAFVRERAAHSLGNIGDNARHAPAPKLRDLLGDSDQAVRKRAAWALGLVHDARVDTVQRLANMVMNGTPVDAGAALHALGNVGKSAGPDFLAPYREQILAALGSSETEVRRWALYAAESIGLDAQTWSDTLTKIVRHDESDEVRYAALSNLKRVASSVDLASAVPSLVARLDGLGREASLVCEVLGSMRPRPTSAVPFLRKALARDELVLPAALALWHIERRADSVIPAMRRVFDDYGEGVCDVICELGPAASPLVPDVIKALAEENWDLQWAAADALRAIASSDERVLRTLLDALAHPSPIVRSASARALAVAGVAAVKSLRGLLVDTSDSRASLAAYALGEMGPAAAEALFDLRAGMRCGSEPLAGCCAIAVARVAGDVAAVPYLVDTLRSDDPVAPRQAAAKALADLGPAATAAVEALEALVDDGDIDVAETSVQALTAIRGLSH
jgi:HEAT repeat protein